MAKIPDALTFAEAATFPCAAVTAWHALVGCQSPVGVGDTVLALGSGGVAMFALQVARLREAKFIATTSNAAKRERLQAAGADVVLNYAAAPGWGLEAQQATGRPLIRVRGRARRLQLPAGSPPCRQGRHRVVSQPPKA